MNNSVDNSLDEQLKYYIDAVDITDEQTKHLAQAVMAQLDAAPSGETPILAWLTQTWWRPLVASALPLMLGFVVGLNSELLAVESQPADIVGMVYMDGAEETNFRLKVH